MSRIKQAATFALAALLVIPTIAHATISTSTALDGGGGVTGEGIQGALADNATGSGRTAVSFAFPAGRGGLTPSLSIGYDSSAGDGEAGLGWSLSLPSIRRVRNPNAFEYKPDSDTASAYSFPGPNDRFEWNGNPLVEVCAAAGNGCIPGEQFSPDKTGTRYFRLRVDSSFTRFFYRPHPFREAAGTWIVEYKSGLTEIYGGDAASDVFSEGVHVEGVRFRLSRQIDTHPGNVIHYVWKANPEGVAPGSGVTGRRGLKYLSDIYYTPATAKVLEGTGIEAFDPRANYESHVRLAWEEPDFRQQFFAPPWAATPDLRLARVDVATKPSTAIGSGSARQQLRRYHLRYLESNLAGKPAVAGGPLLEYRHGIDGPLRGHSFLKEVQMEGRCAQPIEESDVGENRFVLPESTNCPMMPPTSFEYSPRTTMQTLAAESTVRPRFSITDGEGRVNITFNHHERIALVDIDRDGRPDILEGWWNAQRNRGTAGIFAPKFVGDCLETAGLPIAPYPLPSPIDWTPFLDNRLGLTLSNFYGYTGEGLTFLWRNNETSLNRTFPGHAWAAANLVPKPSPCPASLAADAPRRTWGFVRDDDGLTPGPGLRPKPASPTGKPDGLFITGDVDGDGLQDAYVRKQEATDGGNIIRFSRRDLVRSRGIAPFAERVHAQLDVVRPCGASGCLGPAFDINGNERSATEMGDPIPYDQAHRALVDMNGDGLADYLASTLLRNPAPAESESGYIRDVDFGYLPGDGQAAFKCEEGKVSAGPLPSCTLDLALRRVVGLGTTRAIPVAPNTGFAQFPIWKGLPTKNADGVWVESHRPIFFADINADGYTDVIVARQHERRDGGNWIPENGISFAIYINEDGFTFHRYCAEDPSGASYNDSTDPEVTEREQPGLHLGDVKIAFADIRSHGVQDIVVVTPNKVLSLGFGPIEIKPGLLTKIHNGFGATTELKYQTYQQASMAFAPSEDEKLEAVRYVVTQTVTSNGLPVGTSQARSVTTNYTYRGPAYDPWERKFLGFRRVVESRADGPSVVSDYKFGRCFSRDGCPQTSDRSLDPPRLLTTVTTYASNPVREDGTIDGNVRAISQVQYINAVFRLPAGADQRFHLGAYVREERTLLFDTDAPPAPTFLTVPVLTREGPGFEGPLDDFIDVAVPSIPPFMLRTTQHVDVNGNADYTQDHGRVGIDLSPIDTVRSTEAGFTRIVVSGVAPGITHDWTWRKEKVSLAALGSTTRQSEFLYYPNGDLHKTKGYLTDQFALERRHETALKRIANDPPGIESDGWKERGEYVYDDFGNLTKVMAPSFEAIGGTRRRCTLYGYEKDYNHFVDSTKVPTNGCDAGGAEGPQFTLVGQAWDRGFGVPVSTHSAGTVTTVEIDGFGRPTKVFDPSPSVPEAVELVPLVSTTYFDTAPVSRVETLTRDPQGAVSQMRAAIGYVDSSGTTLMTLQEHEAGDWVASNVMTRTPTGLPSMSYRPYRYSGSKTNPSFDPPSSVKRMTMSYDAFDRPTGSFDQSTGVQLGKVEYGVLRSTVYDANDLDPSSIHVGTPVTTVMDGHGQVSFVMSSRQRLDGTMEASHTWYAYDVAGEAIVEGRGTDDGLHSRLRQRSFDTFGRVTLQVEPNTTTAAHQIRYAYNATDQLVGTSDARGCGENFHYDGAGRLVATDSSPCLDSQPLYTDPILTTGDGTESFNRFDTPEPGVPASAYGEGATYPGLLLATYERGAHSRFSYDLRGRATKVSRRVAKPGLPEELLADRYTPHWYESASTYDTNDRVTAMTTGADVTELMGADGLGRMSFAYGPRGHLTAVGSSYGNLIVSNQFRDDGLLARTEYGDAAQTATTFSYDETVNARLREIKVDRAGSPTWTTPPLPAVAEPVQQTVLADTVLTRDRVGNVTEIKEDLDGDDQIWPRGAKPRTRTIHYDDYYRVTHVSSVYSGPGLGNDIQVPVFKHEAGGSRAVPRSQVSTRRRAEAFQYDYLGNITRSQDDEQVRFDRSLGVQQHDPAKPEQLVSADGVSVHYDDSGNMTDVMVIRPGPCDHTQPCNQRFIYDWDETGQLSRARRYDYATIVPGVTAQYPDPPSGEPEWDLHYSYAGGERVVKAAKTPGEDETYTLEIFDTLRVNRTAFEDDDYVRDATHEAVYLAGGARVVYGSTNLPLSSAGQTRVFFNISDELGSTSLVIDRATGELVEKVSYGAFGETEADYRPERWDSFREELRFTGKEEDEEVGLTYFGARYLSTRLERWISPDPLTIHAWASDSNPYAYVRGNVMNSVDPTGLTDKPVQEPKEAQVEQVTVTGQAPDRRGRFAAEEGHLARLPDQGSFSLGSRSASGARALAGALRGASAGIVSRVGHAAKRMSVASYKAHVKALGIALNAAIVAVQQVSRPAKPPAALTFPAVEAKREAVKGAIQSILPPPGSVAAQGSTMAGKALGQVLYYYLEAGLDALTDAVGNSISGGGNIGGGGGGGGEGGAENGPVGPNFDVAREAAFQKAGLTDPADVTFSKEDPVTGTITEFKGPGGAKVGYDGPHPNSPGSYHDQQHISAQAAGKRPYEGAKQNFPYSGPRHPSRPDRKK